MILTSPMTSILSWERTHGTTGTIRVGTTGTDLDLDALAMGELPWRGIHSGMILSTILDLPLITTILG